MNSPVHFDLAQVEQHMRAHFAELNSAARPAGMTARDKEFVRVQISLQDALVAVTLWHVQCRNDAVDPGVAAEALGCAIGQMMSSFAGNSGFRPDEAIAMVFDSALDVIDQFHGDTSRPAGEHILRKSSVKGQVGGRA
jgi:hypothetical protein